MRRSSGAMMFEAFFGLVEGMECGVGVLCLRMKRKKELFFDPGKVFVDHQAKRQRMILVMLVEI